MDKTHTNVILINCDDMGYGDLGCYGSEVNDTKAIDWLAGEGIRFTNFYAASPLCSPSRGALMTSCYPPRISFGEFEGNGVLFPGQGIGLNPKEYTVARMFKEHGYATKMVGKWHCGDQPAFLPTVFGFDEYYGLPYSNDMGMQANTAGRKVRKHPPLPLLRNCNVIQEQPDQRGLTERYVQECVQFIMDNRDRPFFLYLAHMHVHLPLYAAEVFVKRSRNGDFGACMMSIDWATESILAALRKESLLEDTIILFTSDNGSRNDNGASNGGLRGRKGTTWDGGQRVPCILYWSRLKKGICSRVSSNLDIMPTLAGLLGWKVDFPKPIDGQDISGYLRGTKDREEGEELFFYYLRNTLEAVRKGEWKLHFVKEGSPVKLLYHISEDMGESRNCYEKYPEIVEELERTAENMRRRTGDAFCHITGKEVRKPGVAENPKPLTCYRPDHPYIIHMYDREERG